MIDEPLVSIIIPTYNQENFIRETLESVLAQTYNNMEIIITDDNSSDSTLEIIQEYALKYSKVKIIKSDKNTGVVKNSNRALKASKGELIAWLGGDDLMMPEKIQKQVDLLKRRPDAVGCCHDAIVFENESGKIIGLFSEIYNGKRGLKEGGVELLFDPGYYMLPSTIMFRSIFRPIHGFDERLIFGDWLFDIELFRNGKCAVINEALGKYRRHDRNITSSDLAKTKGLEENFIILGIIDSRYPELHPFVKRLRKSYYIGAAGISFRNGDIGRSDDYIKILIQEWAIIQAIIAYLSLRLFKKYILSQINKEPYQRSRLFTLLIRILARGL